MDGKRTWAPLGAVAPDSLAAARLDAHHAAQWVTRAARANLAAEPDDSHSNLGWDSGRRALVTHDLPAGEGPARVGLDIATLTIVFEPPDGTPREVALDGQRDQLAGRNIGRMLRDGGLSAERLDDPLPYTIPPRPVTAGALYDAAGNKAALAELAAYYDIAALLLDAVAEADARASQVRCWPHHFDLATLIALDGAGGRAEDARSIGVGLSPGDETHAQPYFYVAPWPYPDAADLPPPGEIGRWHTEGFTAYVILAEEIVARATAEEQQAATAQAIDAAIAASRTLLGD